MKQYKVGLVGIGAVGTEMIKVLRQRNFPASEIRILATRERDEVIAGETFHVLETTPEAFEGLDIVLFAGTEGSKGASKMWGKVATDAGAIVIDKDPSGYRKAMGVSSITPLKGHLQGALAVYTADYYTKGGIADGASLSIYDTDARTAQQAEYQNAKNNWSKWLTNAGL
jgi:hypothetical protein